VLVRGEAFMSKADFAALNERQEGGGKIFANPQTPPPARPAEGPVGDRVASLRFLAHGWGAGGASRWGASAAGDEEDRDLDPEATC
jgi:DNA ligase (NAD+)